MICQQCQNTIDDKSKACPYCGRKVGRKSSKKTGCIIAALVSALAVCILLLVLVVGGGALALGAIFLLNYEQKAEFVPAPDAIEEIAPAPTEAPREYLFFSEDGGSCYHIPVVQLENVQADSINEEMYDVHYGHLEEMVFGEEYPFLLGMTYSVGQKGDLVSVMVQESYDADCIQYTIYNFSASTGQKVSDAEVFAEFGLSEDDGRSIMQDSLVMYWENRCEELGYSYYDSFMEEIINKTISDSNIQACTPFIDEYGNLRYVGSIYSAAGADYYDCIFDDYGSTWRVECAQH